MEIVKYIVLGIYTIVCVSIIVLALLQAKNSSGASGAIVGGDSGSGSGNFYEKNKGRTKEGKMKRWTIILGIIFVILSIGLGIMFEFGK